MSDEDLYKSYSNFYAAKIFSSYSPEGFPHSAKRKSVQTVNNAGITLENKLIQNVHVHFFIVSPVLINIDHHTILKTRT